jgi:ABC-type polysaccharide/polyol phosphate export permease
MGYFWSILAMMAAPYVLVVVIGTVIVRRLRAEARHAAGPQ